MCGFGTFHTLRRHLTLADEEAVAAPDKDVSSFWLDDDSPGWGITGHGQCHLRHGGIVRHDVGLSASAGALA